MCSPRQLFVFHCGSEKPKGWTPPVRSHIYPSDCLIYESFSSNDHGTRVGQPDRGHRVPPTSSNSPPSSSCASLTSPQWVRPLALLCHVQEKYKINHGSGAKVPGFAPNYTSLSLG